MPPAGQCGGGKWAQSWFRVTAHRWGYLTCLVIRDRPCGIALLGHSLCSQTAVLLKGRLCAAKQAFNPPLAHSIDVASPPWASRRFGRLVAVARGDGHVALYDADHVEPGLKKGTKAKVMP